jgi:hypothetical protein
MSLLEDLHEGEYEIKQWAKNRNRVKRKAKDGEMVEIIKTGEIKKVQWTFSGGVHLEDFNFTSYLDDEYLVLE